MNITKKSIKKKVSILYDSNNMTFWQRQNFGDGNKVSCCQELGKVEHRSSLGQRKYPACGNGVWLYPTQCTTPRMNRNVNYGLRVIMTC